MYDVVLLDDYVSRAHAPFRLNSWIVSTLAALSLILAVAGVFAVTTYDAAARSAPLARRSSHERSR